MATKNFFIHDGLKVKGDTLLNGASYNDSALSKLHVKTAANGVGANLNNVNGIIVENSGSSNSNYALKLATGAGNIFNVTNSGEVGIGTATTAAKLHLFTNQAEDLILRIDSNSTGNSFIELDRQTSGGTAAIVFQDASTDVWGLGTLGADRFEIFENTDTARLTIIPGGNVGLGTTDPDEKLHVRGEQVYLYNDIDTNNTYFYARNSSSGNAGIKMKNSQGEWTIIANDRLRFYDDDNSIERFTILSSGNVGLGTTTPAYGLDIRNSTTSQTGALYIQAALNSSGKGLVIDSNTRDTADNAEHLLQIIDRSNSNSLVTTVEGVTLVRLGTRLNTLSPLQVNSQIALGGSLYTFSTVQGGADLTLTSNANPANIGVLSNIKFKLGSSGGGGPNERMRIQSDGSIGIWNTTDIENWAGSTYRAIEFPRASLMYHTGTSTDLYINSNAYYDGAWKYKSTAAASQFILGSSGDALIRTIASGTIDTGITWTTPFIVKNTGNVGIDTTSPTQKLQVGGTATEDTAIKIDSAANSNANKSWLINATQADALLRIGSENNPTSLVIKGSDGNVGIGTDDPTRELEIHGTGNVYARVTASTDNDSAALELNNNENEIWVLKADDTANDYFKISNNAGTAFTIDTSRRVGVGTTSPAEKLDVVGNVKHQGLTMTSGTDIDQLKTFTQTLTITTSWQDTGIDGSDLTTGTYIVQLLGDDDEVAGTYSVYYSGMMSWYSSGTNDADFTSEIALHRAGHADVGHTLYLRTSTNNSGGNDLELQIAGNYNATGSDSYIFKFRRMI